MQGGQDRVQSYFGMRKISLGRVSGETNPRILLNNLFVFQMGILDQVTSTPQLKACLAVLFLGHHVLLLHLMCCC